MTTETRPARALLPDATSVLARLPRMGSVMVNTRYCGATHERMGVVDEVVRVDGMLHCRSAAHDSEIDPSTIEAVIVDRTGRMKDVALPRIDFHDRTGVVVFSVIGMDGSAPFEAGLDGLAEKPIIDDVEKPAREPAALVDGDQGSRPFEAAMKSGATVTIELGRPGFRQRWTGMIGGVSPAMGFINVMRPDFHLHLRGGAVASWRAETAEAGRRLSALSPDGEATGLSITGPEAAFAGLEDA